MMTLRAEIYDFKLNFMLWWYKSSYQLKIFAGRKCSVIGKVCTLWHTQLSAFPVSMALI
jgi:hypothetical protein